MYEVVLETGSGTQGSVYDESGRTESFCAKDVRKCLRRVYIIETNDCRERTPSESARAVKSHEPGQTERAK